MHTGRKIDIYRRKSVFREELICYKNLLKQSPETGRIGAC
ncbi:hypothetical protein SAMN05444682_11710 [Parapedobacter indicus]|uniref:Uncharacterized protein n=1 Tax=Parapedobacter indicus TaxID=1477437 RepID=A0A1I3VH21_9SPHI|nr:hypothetical protein CLV26_11738 [Parapedobacter indicus]SFJ94668.1 hypothetical protein SAMN05444682_11710 [Parapedobacter indicus]